MKTLPDAKDIIRRRHQIADLRAAVIQDKEDGATVEGHAAVYGQTVPIGDWFNEVIEPGAFDGADLTDVLFFVNHDTDEIPLARSRRNNGNSTMQLVIDDQGLYFKASLDTANNAMAKSLYSAVNRGDITGMSFMFRIAEERWEDLDKEMPTRHIIKIKKVLEISAVNSPAYSETDINARDRQALDSAKNALDNARSSPDGDQSELALLKEKLKLR